MATITVRDLPDSVRDALKARARRNRRSMEAEARAVIAAAVVDVMRPPLEIEVDPSVWDHPAAVPPARKPGTIRLSKLPAHELRTAASIDELIEDNRGEW